MKILVTGSDGLVGKKIVELLVAQKKAVVLFSHDKDHDILNPVQLQKAMKGCDFVIHCAAILNSEKDHGLLWKTNVEGTKNVVSACIGNKVRRLVFLSSVGVYGTEPGTKNESSKVSPKTVYDRSKITAEQAVLQNGVVPFTIVRSALVVGPNRHWKRIVGFVQKDLPLIGNGRQTWQTVHYADLADAVLFLLFSKDAENEIFIVAGNEKPSLLEFTQSIRKSLGKKGNTRTIPLWFGKMAGWIASVWFAITKKPNPLSRAAIEGMVQERVYDTSKIEKLGWKNKFSYAESIRQTLQEMKKNNHWLQK